VITELAYSTLMVRDYNEAMLGVEFVEGPINHYYGRVAGFKDLYGNRIDLIQPNFL